MTSHLLPTYGRAHLAFERGEGPWLFSTDGERYLDFTAGVAVNALGHAHPGLVAALTAQAHKLWHVSNVFEIPEAERLAARLCAHTFADLVFFCNSGAEAIECAIKTARCCHYVSGRPERQRIVAFEGAFHGRTLASLAAGGHAKYLEGFGPVAGGFDHVPFADIDAVRKAVGPHTAAILIEPVQGEGGVRVAPPAFLRALRELCDATGALLVFDEVQTGVGRTGTLFAHQHSGVTPDIMGIAKALGGGFPLGACLVTAEAGKGMTPGTHGSTFGGNPLAMSVGNAVLDVVLAPGFLDEVKRSAAQLRARLAEIKDRHPAVVAEVRGEGLLIGIVAGCRNTDLVDALRAERLLTVAAGDNVVRLLPPLIVKESEIAQAADRVERAAARLGQAAGRTQAAGMEAAGVAT